MEFKQPPVAESSKAEYAYRKIREKIVDNTYPPDTVLSIRELSAQLDVSRTPVKEAISRLAYEGFVDLAPDRAAIVSKISYTDVVELLEVRECLEASAAFYAAKRRSAADIRELEQVNDFHRGIPFAQTQMLTEWDYRFHITVAKISQNRQLLSMLESIFVPFSRVTLPITKVESRLYSSLAQHDAVLNAIKDGDSEAAQRSMVEHVRDILTSVKVYQYQNIHLFK
jgi:DNA-binding GntR family transcriptional regulator